MTGTRYRAAEMRRRGHSRDSDSGGYTCYVVLGISSRSVAAANRLLGKHRRSGFLYTLGSHCCRSDARSGFCGCLGLCITRPYGRRVEPASTSSVDQELLSDNRCGRCGICFGGGTLGNRCRKCWRSGAVIVFAVTSRTFPTAGSLATGIYGVFLWIIQLTR